MTMMKEHSLLSILFLLSALCCALMAPLMSRWFHNDYAITNRWKAESAGTGLVLGSRAQHSLEWRFKHIAFNNYWAADADEGNERAINAFLEGNTYLFTWRRNAVIILSYIIQRQRLTVGPWASRKQKRKKIKSVKHVLNKWFSLILIVVNRSVRSPQFAHCCEIVDIWFGGWNRSHRWDRSVEFLITTWNAPFPILNDMVIAANEEESQSTHRFDSHWIKTQPNFDRPPRFLATKTPNHPFAVHEFKSN